MKKWQINQPNDAVVRKLQSGSDLSALCAAVLAARGIETLEEAAAMLQCDALSDPFLIQDMQTAADIIGEAMEQGTRLCVYGDYDCDGVMATVILYSYLMEMGADVQYYIPERSEGYGMNEQAIRQLHEEGVEMIITVDNGITAIREAALIYELGMRLVITDHHQTLESFPRAEAIVDPHRQDCPSSFKQYCGAGLALLLVAAMCDGDTQMAMEQFGELAAIATVADVVPLSGENRYLVMQGLRLLANTERAGLLALLEKSGVLGKKMTASVAAFSLAPRINAAGRFGSPKTAVALLLSEDPEEAAALANELEHCNVERKATEEIILQEIQQQIQRQPELLLERVLVFAGHGWHHGVIGIVASRLEERFGKPVFIITIEENGARGSARGFGAFSVFGCLDACHSHLMKYGGHMGAGGFSLEPSAIPAFTAAVQAYAAANHPQMPQLTLTAEKVLMPQDLTLENIAGLEIMEPYGADNEQPVFAICQAVLKSIDPLSGGRHSRLRLLYGGMAIEALLFRTAPEEIQLKREDVCDLLVTVGVNVYNGRSSLSLMVKDYRKSGVKQSKYFAARSAYEQYRRGEALPDAYYKAICPQRSELVTVYRCLPEKSVSVDALVLHFSQQGMNYCKLRLILDIFAELGLAEINGYDETVRRLSVTGTVNLEESVMLRRLREKNGEV